MMVMVGCKGIHENKVSFLWGQLILVLLCKLKLIFILIRFNHHHLISVLY
jgi:hypothetical protein